MAIVQSYKGKLPKRIGDDYVVYKSIDGIIVREKTGFTSEGVLHDPKYENCRKNYSEFGLVSKSCKGIRVALQSLLPKDDNLAVVNNFNKHMRSVLNYDTIHARGGRLLQTALEQEEGKQHFIGYCFIPGSPFRVRATVTQNALQLDALHAPNELSCFGFRVHVLDYDWEELTGTLHSGAWHLEPSLPFPLSLPLPSVKSTKGSLIYLLEVQAFEERDGDFVVVKGSGLVVVGVAAPVAFSANLEVAFSRLFFKRVRSRTGFRTLRAPEGRGDPLQRRYRTGRDLSVQHLSLCGLSVHELYTRPGPKISDCVEKCDNDYGANCTCIVLRFVYLT
ncbi:hypothetical protein [Flavobacterium orientale]|uniref:Uncharacterized protein n=1 Tax=Flavobacterium orientale TaxID=1756020 RepID=A0A916Y542_9FLAO|nr:hypothetical protein [Flavobacterium orientale]GGD30955.1 hypothetical protein GCM10011343_21370 [Flavobacterium orientale]